MKVYVVNMSIPGEDPRPLSVHRTEAGAQNKIEKLEEVYKDDDEVEFKIDIFTLED